jgi:hypothetical protein
MPDPFSLAPAPESYWHLWTDDQGISHQEQCTISSFELGQLGPGDSPQFSRPLFDQGNAFVTYLPVGWTADWHENHIPKWIYVLRGAWSVESMDGRKVIMRAGEYSFGGDQDCIATPAGQRGHLSAQVGDEPCVQLIIQRNNEAWRRARPGFFS